MSEPQGITTAPTDAKPKEKKPFDPTKTQSRVRMLVRTSKKKDQDEIKDTLETLQLKLSQKEWDMLVEGKLVIEGHKIEGQIPKAFADKCIKDFNMLRKHSVVKPKGEGKPRVKSYMGTPAEADGIEFDKAFATFKEIHKSKLENLSKNGVEFYSYFKDERKKGSRPKTEEAPKA